MNEILDRVSELVSPAYDGYGIAWILVCPEASAGALLGATDLRDAQTVARLASTLLLEEVRFLAETIYTERRHRSVPSFQLSPEDFRAATLSANVLPTSYTKRQLLPKQWFSQGRRNKRRPYVH